MDLQNFDMDDRVHYTLRAIPKRGKNDFEKLQKGFQKLKKFSKKFKFFGRTKSNENISAVMPPLKKVKQLKKLSDDELKQEWRELLRIFRSIRDAIFADEMSTLTSKGERKQWKAEFKKLRRKVEAPSILDEYLHHLALNEEIRR
ncbi:13505_t:CDS:1 [Ambispora leptoticha]|uniref:13505_t:CDS:1 n=1 Tax=Ambispora leptoticha TaxID=144679 RepID=A0A9N9DZC3_9GLOM|nr:13505_t:CDS:1 [Ambispora leptoticha]